MYMYCIFKKIFLQGKGILKMYKNLTYKFKLERVKYQIWKLYINMIKPVVVLD